MTDNKPKQNKNMKKKTYENQAHTHTWNGLAWKITCLCYCFPYTHTHFNGATKELKTYSITMLSVLHTEHIAKLMANKWAECNVCCNLSLIRGFV